MFVHSVSSAPNQHKIKQSSSGGGLKTTLSLAEHERINPNRIFSGALLETLVTKRIVVLTGESATVRRSHNERSLAPVHRLGPHRRKHAVAWQLRNLGPRVSPQSWQMECWFFNHSIGDGVSNVVDDGYSSRLRQFRRYPKSNLKTTRIGFSTRHMYFRTDEIFRTRTVRQGYSTY